MSLAWVGRDKAARGWLYRGGIYFYVNQFRHKQNGYEELVALMGVLI